MTGDKEPKEGKKSLRKVKAGEPAKAWSWRELAIFLVGFIAGMFF